MGKTSKKKKTLDDTLYVIPAWFTDRKKYNLATIGVPEFAKLRESTVNTEVANRKRYENAASAFTRLMIDARTVYPEEHEVMRVLKKNAVKPPSDLMKRFEALHRLWVQERQATAARLHNNELARTRYADRKTKQEQPRQPIAEPVILALPSGERSTLRRESLWDARRREAGNQLQTILRSGNVIKIPPSPGQALVDIAGDGQQLLMFSGATDMSGLYG